MYRWLGSPTDILDHITKSWACHHVVGTLLGTQNSFMTSGRCPYYHKSTFSVIFHVYDESKGFGRFVIKVLADIPHVIFSHENSANSGFRIVNCLGPCHRQVNWSLPSPLKSPESKNKNKKQKNSPESHHALRQGGRWSPDGTSQTGHGEPMVLPTTQIPADALWGADLMMR